MPTCSGRKWKDDLCNRRSDQEKALELYKELHGSDSTNAEIFWRLGWLYDELGRCDESIVANQQEAKEDRIAPWAYWNLAVSYLKLSRLKQGVEKQRALDSAIDALGAIPAGPMWDFIYNDAELEGLRVDPRFSALWRRRSWKVRARANA